MVNTKGPLIGVAAVAVVAIVFSAISLTGSLALRPQAVEPVKDRLIWMDAVEYKGATDTAKLAPPSDLSANPMARGDAFGFKWVQDPQKRWEVSAYAFTPSTVVVNQGDRVTLRIFGVNGDLHRIYVEGYAQNVVELNRGRSVDISFTADESGLFQIVCSNHEPAMRGWLAVNPR
jgi:plastocyanin